MDHNQMKPKHISRRTFVTGYSASKINENDGGRVLNGWVAQKDFLDIHDFGLQPYTGSDWSSIADYNIKNPWYVPASVYNNYISSCNATKQSAYFPAGDYVLEDGQYALPTYGLNGDDKDCSKLRSICRIRCDLGDYT